MPEMVSTTATALASNRRRLRLAQHNVRANASATTTVVGADVAAGTKAYRAASNRGTAASSSTASKLAIKPSGKNSSSKKAVGSSGGRSSSPDPSPTLTVGTTVSSSPTDGESTTSVTSGSSSLSPAARRRLIRHAAGDNTGGIAPHGGIGSGGGGPRSGGSGNHQRALSDGAVLHQNAGKYHQRNHQRTRSAAVGEASAGGGHHRSIGRGGGVARPQHMQDAQQQQHQSQSTNGRPTSRGRSRRSRAATRRGTGNNRDAEMGRVEEEDDENGNNNAIGAAKTGSAGVGGVQRTTDVDGDPLALNLHVAESVDSDDNGTCFNSIGTTTPRQPSPRHVVKNPPNTGGHVPEQQAKRSEVSSKRGGRRRNRLNASEGLSPLLETRSPLTSPQKNNGRLDPPEAPFGNGVGGEVDAEIGGSGGRTSRPRSLKKVPPEPTHFGKFGSETTGKQVKKLVDSTRGDSIWERPEEMMHAGGAGHPAIDRVNANRTNSNANSAGTKGATSRSYKPAAGDNSSNYSEFDQEGSYRGGGGSHNTTASRRGGPAHPANYGHPSQQRRPGRTAMAHRSSGNLPLGPPHGGNSIDGRMDDVTNMEAGWFSGPSAGVAEGVAGGGGRPAAPDGGLPKAVGLDDEDGLLNRPNVKAALGVGAAATLGAIVLGPVGLLVGAASVGIGMGVMQIPEEQRNNVRAHAAASVEKARDIACDLSDHMSSNCARYTGHDPKEVVGRVVPDEIMGRCCSGGEDGRDGVFRGGRGGVGAVSGPHYRGSLGDYDGHSLAGDDYPRGIGPGGGPNAFEVRSEGSSPIANAVDGVGRGMNRLVGDVFGDEHPSPTSQSAMGGDTRGGGGGGVGHPRGGGNGVGGGDHGAMSENEDAGRRVACGRKGRVVPLSQIHSLRPSLQPRAWLDVMASAHTTRDDKNEAMQEILILAKDKEISRWFLEEGILDSLMFILSNYFRNYSSFLRDETPPFASESPEPFSSFKSGGEAFYHARLAANCCVALGKAHCAAVHTEGDLLLMSAYSRGSVPVERQLAQMLFEVPHHMKVMDPSRGGACGRDAGVGEAGGGGGGGQPQQQQFDAEFTLTELSMQQAEDLASSIKALDDGKIDV